MAICHGNKSHLCIGPRVPPRGADLEPWASSPDWKCGKMKIILTPYSFRDQGITSIKLHQFYVGLHDFTEYFFFSTFKKLSPHLPKIDCILCVRLEDTDKHTEEMSCWFRQQEFPFGLGLSVHRGAAVHSVSLFEQGHLGFSAECVASHTASRWHIVIQVETPVQGHTFLKHLV